MSLLAVTSGSMGVPTCGATHPVVVKYGNPRLTVNGKPIVCTGVFWGMHARPKSAPHPEFSTIGSARLTVDGKPVTLNGMLLSNGATAMAIPCNLFVSG